MRNAQQSIWYDIIVYVVFLWIVIMAVTFIIGMARHISCCSGPKNAYEHFQDANAVDNHINQSLIQMNATLDQYSQQLQDAMTNTSNMKVQTCSIYDGVHDKFIKSTASEVADESEYQLPKAQQKLLQQNRAKNAEQTWANQMALYMYRHGEKGMIDCSKVDVSASTQADLEGFQDALAPTTLDNLAQNLQGKVNIFNKTLASPTVQSWLTDCVNIEGTADYLNVYINNVQVNAEIQKCKADYTKNISGFDNEDGDTQKKQNDAANISCNIKYGSQLESFQDTPYVNTQFSFPVPYPTAGLTAAQVGYYQILSAAQDSLNNFSKQIGTIYQTTVASYTRMNKTNNTYIAYKKQMDSVQDKNYNQSQAQSLKS